MNFQLSVSDNQDKVLLGIKVYKEVNSMLNFPSNCYGGILIGLNVSALAKKILQQGITFMQIFRSYFRQMRNRKLSLVLRRLFE